jgi:hypothetical protein
MRLRPATNGGAGQVEAIEDRQHHLGDAPVGRGPVYGVMTLDSRRAFILNQTDGTVSVINASDQRAGHAGEYDSGGDGAGVGGPCVRAE